MKMSQHKDVSCQPPAEPPWLVPAALGLLFQILDEAAPDPDMIPAPVESPDGRWFLSHGLRFSPGGTISREQYRSRRHSVFIVD
jgi:hypothetical protein